MQSPEEPGRVCLVSALWTSTKCQNVEPAHSHWDSSESVIFIEVFQPSPCRNIIESHCCHYISLCVMPVMISILDLWKEKWDSERHRACFTCPNYTWNSTVLVFLSYPEIRQAVLAEVCAGLISSPGPMKVLLWKCLLASLCVAFKNIILLKVLRIDLQSYSAMCHESISDISDPPLLTWKVCGQSGTAQAPG